MPQHDRLRSCCAISSAEREATASPKTPKQWHKILIQKFDSALASKHNFVLRLEAAATACVSPFSIDKRLTTSEWLDDAVSSASSPNGADERLKLLKDSDCRTSGSSRLHKEDEVRLLAIS